MPLLEQVLEKYPKEVKLVFKHFPLNQHKFAGEAAIAATVADSYGKYWDFHDKLYLNYNRLNDQKIQDIVRELGLNVEKFEEQMKDPEVLKKVGQDARDGIKVGVRGVPTVFINGRLLTNRSMEGFQEAIDKELKGISKGGDQQTP